MVPDTEKERYALSLGPYLLKKKIFEEIGEKIQQSFRRSYFSLIKNIASEMKSIENENSGDFQFLITGSNRL